MPCLYISKTCCLTRGLFFVVKNSKHSSLLTVGVLCFQFQPSVRFETSWDLSVGIHIQHPSFNYNGLSFCFQPSVRFEACRGLYKLSLIKENSCLIQLMDALLDSLPLAQSLQSKENFHGRRQEPSAREYFSILCRLVDGLPTVEGRKVKICHVFFF